MNEILSLLEPMRKSFSSPSFLHFQALIACLWSLPPVTGGNLSLVRIWAQTRTSLHWDALMRFVRLYRWDADQLAQALTHQVLQVVDPLLTVQEDGRKQLLLGVDETLDNHYSAKKMFGVSKHFNHSAHQGQSRYLKGHLWVTLSILLKAGTPQLRAICVNIALYLARFVCRGNEYVSVRALSLGMVLKLQKWVGLEYSLVIVADAYYACRKFVREVCRSDLRLITRIRGDARIYDLPANAKRARRGRKRLYGERIHLRRRARNLEKFSPPCEVFIYGKQHRVRVRKVVGRWFGICDVVSIVIVVGIGKKPVYLLDTDPQADPMETLKLYGARYAIEQQYADLKGQGGLGKYRGRSEKGVRRFALLCVVAHSLLHLIGMSPRLCGLLPRVEERWRKERSRLTIGQIRERIGRLYMKALVEGNFLNVALGHREQQNYQRASQVLQKAA